jgi:hypothetical protein
MVSEELSYSGAVSCDMSGLAAGSTRPTYLFRELIGKKELGPACEARGFDPAFWEKLCHEVLVLCMTCWDRKYSPLLSSELLSNEQAL